MGRLSSRGMLFASAWRLPPGTALRHDSPVMNGRFASTFSVLVLSLLLAFAPGLRAVEFYVSRHHWHSGIVVARADIPAGIWPPGVVERDFAGCRCLELGWGDRTFYTAPKPTVLMGVKAALIPGWSVLHIAGFPGPPSGTHQWAELVRVSCTRAELVTLCRALGESFERDASGNAQRLGRGLYGLKSQFYAARGDYWIGNTCNSWTLREARAGGLPTRIGPAGTLSSGAVTGQVRRLLAARSQKSNQ